MSQMQFTACLLAGGKSSRMGRDKAGVEFGGMPLWQHQVQTLRALNPSEILISGRRDGCYAASGFPIIEDQVANVGPLGGVGSLLFAAAYPLVLILAIDMPFITSEWLRALLGHCAAGSGAVAGNNGLFEGLAAIYPKVSHPLAVEALRGGDPSMQHFVAECVSADLLHIVNTTTSETPLFRSMNSPADLANSAS